VTSYAINPVSNRITFVLGGNCNLLRLNAVPRPLINRRTYQHLAAFGSVAVTGGAIYSFSDNREFHSFTGPYEPMQNLSSMDSDSDFAANLASIVSALAYISRGCLHVHGGAYRFPAVFGICFGTSKYRQNRIADELVNGAVMAENAVGQSGEVFVEKGNDFIGGHPSR